MATVAVPNTRAAEKAVVAPVKDDGTPYPLAMQFNGFNDVAFADTVLELLDHLIPGHGDMDPQEALTARIMLAVRAQVITQAHLISEASDADRSALTDVEREVLTGNRVKQPSGWGGDNAAGDVWASNIPLVLVDTGYAPHSDVPVPISVHGDVTDPPNIWWVRPVNEWEFLKSLSKIGYIQLATRH